MSFFLRDKSTVPFLREHMRRLIIGQGSSTTQTEWDLHQKAMIKTQLELDLLTKPIVMVLDEPVIGTGFVLRND